MNHPVPEDKIKVISKRLETIFQKKDLDALGRSLGFIHRQRVVSGFSFAQMCIQGAEESGLNASLTQLLTQCGKLGMSLSSEGLNERFTVNAELFMEHLFTRVASLQLEQELKLGTLNDFSEVLVEDSTTWQLPSCLSSRFTGCGGGASKAGIKLNVRLNLKNADMKLCFRHGKEPDVSAGLGSIQARSLVLRDLGYFKIDDFRGIENAKAFYVSRFKFATHIYESDNSKEQQIDLLALSKKMKVNEVLQMWCYVGKTERFKTRIVLQKVPPEVAQAKRKKLKEDKQNKRKNLSEDRLEFCELNAFITNLPQTSYSAELIMNLYSIRWMIEIIFKVWKSVYHIDEIRPMNEHRFMCLLYGKLIWILLHHKLFSWVKRHFWNTFHIDVSELKGFKILQELKTNLHNAIWKNSFQDGYECLRLFYTLINKAGRKQVRQKKFNQLLFYDQHSHPKDIENQTIRSCFALS